MIMLDEAFPPQIKSQLKLSDGLFLDLSGEGNTITNNGATLTADHKGRANKAFAFTPGNGIVIPNSASLEFSTGLTVCMSLKADAGSTNRYILNKGDLGLNRWQILVSISSSNSIRVGLSGNGTTTELSYRSTTAVTGAWFFLSLVFTPNTLKIYRNAIEVAYVKESNLPLASLFDSNDPIIVNGYLNNGVLTASTAFECDYLLLCNRAIELSEISQLYNEWRK